MAARIISSPAPTPAAGAPLYSLIDGAKLNSLNPQLCLADLLTRIADQPGKPPISSPGTGS